MNLEQARHDLARALEEQAGPNAEDRTRAARQVLVTSGVAALGLDDSSRPSLADVIRLAATAAPTQARRAFAVLLVHALGVDGLVAARSNRGQFDRDICAFMESALPSVLQRAGYPFGGETYARRRSLDRLHTTIEEHLKPLEPTFPPGVRGLYAG
jgi:hypothetical protein